MQSKNSIIIISAIMIILLVVGGIYYWKSRDKEAPTTGEAIELLTETPALTDVVTPTNPLGDKVPEVNPVDKTNPFKDTYKNPFSN